MIRILKRTFSGSQYRISSAKIVQPEAATIYECRLCPEDNTRFDPTDPIFKKYEAERGHLSTIVQIDLHGKVAEWNNESKYGIGRYGYIMTGNRKIIVYEHCINRPSETRLDGISLQVGEHVMFDLQRNEQTDEFRAVNVTGPSGSPVLGSSRFPVKSQYRQQGKDGYGNSLFAQSVTGRAEKSYLYMGMMPGDSIDESIFMITSEHGKVLVDTNCAIGQNLELGQGLEYTFDIQKVEHECESEYGLSAVNIKASESTRSINKEYFDQYEEKMLHWACSGEHRLLENRKRMNEEKASQKSTFLDDFTH